MGTPLHEKKLLLAMPVYRHVDALTFQCVLRLAKEYWDRREFGLGLDVHAGEAPIGRARNDLTAKFLADKSYTHILFADSDIIFSYEQVKRILDHDEDIVGGFYTKKQEGPVAPVCNRLDTVEAPNARGLLKMKYMGTGFLRISRRVFEVMIQEIGNQIGYIDDGDQISKYDFWRMGVHADKNGKRRWLSEDWQFCQFALDLGFDVWADAGITVRHCGPVLFPLSYQAVELYGREAYERMLSPVPVAPEQGAGTGAVQASPPVIAPVTL